MRLASQARFEPIKLLCLLGLAALTACNSLQFPTPALEPSATPVAIRRALVAATPTPSPTPTQFVPAHRGTAIAVPGGTLSPSNAGQMVLFAEHEQGFARQMAASANGDMIVVASSRYLHLYNSWDLQTLDIIPAADMTTSVTFSADGDLLACGYSNGAVQIFDTEKGAIIQESKSEKGQITALAFSPDRSMLAAASTDRIILLWQVPSGQLLRTYTGHISPPTALGFSEDGKTLFSWGSGDALKVWGVAAGGKSKRDFYTAKDKSGNFPVNGTFSGDGKLFAANFGKSIRVFQTSNGYTLRVLNVDNDPLRLVAFSDDGTLLAGLSQRQITIWSPSSGKIVATLNVPKDDPPIKQIAFQRNERLLALSDRLLSWQIPDAEASLARPHEFASNYTISSGINRYNIALTVELDGGMRIWNTDGTLQSVLRAGEGKMSCAAFSADMDMLAAGFWDGSVSLWRPGTGKRLKSLAESQQVLTTLSFSGNQQLLAGGTKDSLLIWQISDGSLIKTIPAKQPIQWVALSNNGKRLISRSAGEVHIWEVHTGKQIAQYKGYAAAYAANADIVAVATLKDMQWAVEIRQVADGKQIASIPAKGYALALSPDGSLLAIAGNEITLWDTHSGILRASLNTGKLYGNLSFSPDGRFLLLTSGDGTLQLWGVP
ncbi:MAG: hypothetical protein HPY45_10915 [Anaerolineae bacterium]|nr:hypothetical protein [Anaerolineae bacterium]